METAITKQNLSVEPTNPGHLLELAINKDLDVEKLTKLMELQKAWQADQARKAFFEAMSKFQSTAPELRKNKKVKFETSKGTTEYSYAPLSDITRQILPACEQNGLTYRWEIKDTKEEIQVTCLITHTSGHTEVTTMTASPDVTGSKNPIQARGSAIEYLKRYTLIGALGISTADSDVDGETPAIDIDILHTQYMREYNKLIQVDGSYTKWHPDNFKSDKTAKLYIRAIGAIRQELIKVTSKEL
jgi:hypothetical protein